jgi:hypothetical protein
LVVGVVALVVGGVAAGALGAGGGVADTVTDAWLAPTLNAGRAA